MSEQLDRFQSFHRDVEAAKAPQRAWDLWLEALDMEAQNDKWVRATRCRFAALDRMAELVGDDTEQVAAYQSLVALRAIKILGDQPLELNDVQRHLRRWIDRFNAPIRRELEASLVDSLAELLGGDKHLAVCQVLAAVGLRTADLLNRLVNHVANASDPEQQAATLHLLIILGVSGDVRAMVHAKLIVLAEIAEPPLAAVRALARLAEPSDLKGTWPALIERLRLCSSAEEYVYMPAARVSEVAEWNWGQEDQDLAWTCIGQASTGNDAVDPYFLSNTESVDTTGQLSGIYRTIAETPVGAAGGAAVSAGRRALELHGAAQVQGWATRLPEAAKDALVTLAGSRLDQLDQTARALRQRDHAWGILVRAALPDCTALLTGLANGALQDEANPFDQLALLELLATLSLAPLPPAVVELLKTETPDAEDRPAAARRIALEVAGSAANQEALDLLLRINIADREDRVDRRYGHAILHCVRAMLDRGETVGLDRILGVLLDSQEPHWRRLAVAYTLATADEVVAAALRAHQRFGEVVRLISSPGSLQAGPVSWLIEAVGGALESADLSDEERGYATTITGLIASGGPSDIVQWVAAVVSASLDTLDPRSAAVQVAVQTIAAAMPNQTEDDGRFPYESARVIGWLYFHSPKAWADQLLACLKHTDLEVSFAALQALRRAHISRREPRPLPGVVCQGLAEVAIAKQCPGLSSPDFLRLAARLAPEDLAAAASKAKLEHWPAASRQVLLDGLMELSEPTTAALACISSLRRDPYASVRQAALRALAQLKPKNLAELCQPQPSDSDRETAALAAEALVWLPAEEAATALAARDNLASHESHEVRQAVVQAWSQRRRRLWADGHLAALVALLQARPPLDATRDEVNQHAGRCWRYAGALALTGEEYHVRRLLGQFPQGLPPHLGELLSQAVEQLRQRVKEDARRRQDDWAPDDAETRWLSADVLDQDGRAQAVDCWLWRSARHEAHVQHSWGGGFRPEGTAVGFTDYNRIRINGAESNILVTSAWTGSDGELVLFVGSGPLRGWTTV